jgi:hypothetical protein
MGDTRTDRGGTTATEASSAAVSLQAVTVVVDARSRAAFNSSALGT